MEFDGSSPLCPFGLWKGFVLKQLFTEVTSTWLFDWDFGVDATIVESVENDERPVVVSFSRVFWLIKWLYWNSYFRDLKLMCFKFLLTYVRVNSSIWPFMASIIV